MDFFTLCGDRCRTRLGQLRKSRHPPRRSSIQTKLSRSTPVSCDLGPSPNDPQIDDLGVSSAQALVARSRHSDPVTNLGFETLFKSLSLSARRLLSASLPPFKSAVYLSAYLPVIELAGGRDVSRLKLVFLLISSIYKAIMLYMYDNKSIT